MPIVIIRNCLAPVSAYFHPPPSPLGSVSSDAPPPPPTKTPLRLPHPRGCLHELKWKSKTVRAERRHRPYARRHWGEKEPERERGDELSLVERLVLALDEALCAPAMWEPPEEG